MVRVAYSPKKTYVVSVFMDITDQKKKSERGLKHKRNQSNKLFFRKKNIADFTKHLKMVLWPEILKGE